MQKIFNKLKEQTGIELDITKPVYLDQTTVTVSTETQVGSQNPCTNAKILSDKEIEETSSYIDLYCTAINELKSLIDNYPESPLISSSYELIADIYFNYLKNKLLARDNYELALLTANSLQKDSIEVKLKDLNKAIGESIEYGHALLDDEALEVSLLRVIPKEDNAEATLRIDSTTTNKKVNDPLFDGIGTDNKGNYRVHLIEIQSDFIRIIKTYSKEDNNGKENLPDPQRYTITLNNRLELVEDKSINKFRLIELLGTDTKEEAIVTILPGSGKETSTSDFSLHIPIEKRAIRFTPEEIDNKIARTKRLIDKLDSVISKLEKTLKVWKATCLITMAVLTVKNSFFNPIKNLARRTVMRGPDGQSGWNQICSDRLRTELDPKTGRPRFRTIDECIEANADEIEQEISNTENVIKRTETLVKSLGNIKETSSQAKLSELIGNDLSQEQIQRLNEIGRLGNDEARNLILLKNSNLDSPQQAEYNKKIEEYKKEADLEIGIQQKLQSTTYEGEDKLRLELSLRKSLPATIKARELYESTSDIVKNYITENNLEDKDFKPIFLVYPEENQPGNLTPQEQKFSTFYDEKKETNLKRLFIGNTQAALNGQEIYIQTDNRGNIINYYVSSGGVSDDSRCPKSLVYSGSPSVIYDDKGKPLIIPIQTPQLDSNYADYVIFGYDLDTKLPNQYSIFNVGLDQIISELNRNTSDDCVVENKESFDDKTQTSKIVSQAYNEALKGYQTVQEKGISSKVKILGKEYFVNYASNRVDELLNPQCTDVFSISDCHIMFGICDPVICPTSRFDFGNTWKVDNVVQTGIVGSVLLGIKNLAPYEPVPVCLTGVLAGLQNIKSILEGLNECLQTAKVKGEYVGICDAITSIYICETVWREGLALYRLKGKVINWMSKDILHQDPDGGEYLTFKNSLKNVEDSAKFLTKDYAQNTFKDYAGKSFDEVGSVICRQAIYSSTPGVGKFLDQVLQPESPPQFTAILNVYPWATLPDEKGRVTQEQSRYQIYYHVYAGNNKAIRYSVILKDPLGRQIYVTENPETVRRIRNSLEAGDYKDKTIDFVAASGYNEVCIEVDGIERCGFGSVTSAFSFNFLKDELVKNELSKPITNEEECTLTNSGLSSSILSLTNTQSKSSFGATYTGIIRECQLDNPGKGTNAQDWKKIPNSDCGKDERGRDLGYCWLYVNPEVLNLDYVQGNENLILNLTGLTKEQVITLDDEEKTKERIQTFSLDERFNELASLTCDDIEKNKKEIITKSNDFIRDSREVMSKSMATNIVDELQFNIAKVYIKLGGCDYLKVQETEAVKYSELITGISKVACTEEMTLELKQEKEFRDYKIRVASIYAPEIKGNKADPLDFDVEPFNPTSGIPQASEDKKYDYSKCNVEFDIMRNGKQIDCVPISSYQLFNLFRKALNVKGINKYSDCENLQIKLLQCNQDNVKLEIRTNELSNSDKNRIEKDIRDAIALENQNGDNIQINKISYVEGQSKILLELSGSISLSLRQKLDEIIQPCRQTLEISQAATDYEGEFQDTVDTIRADIRSMLSVFDLNAIKITINPITANEIRGSTLQLQTNEFLSEQLVLDIQEYLNRYGITLEILNANIICWEINKQNIISEEECHGENDENACFIKKDKKIFGLGFMKKSSCLPCQDSTTMEDLNNDKVRCNDRCKDIAPFHLYYSDRAKLCVV
ncbi:hypothetical protein J4455_02205 [Candidatus Woesearchaeota archaeon]|nr:hypothetical protein [Candidatus Woesearchaeota archaeon]